LASNSSACTGWARRSTNSSPRTTPTSPYRTYAPVGSHRDLLAYLVRRLLENGANSSFVAPGRPIIACRSRRCLKAGRPTRFERPQTGGPSPRFRFRATCSRRSGGNSSGIEFGEACRARSVAGPTSRPRRPISSRSPTQPPERANAAVTAARAWLRGLEPGARGGGARSGAGAGLRICWRAAARISSRCCSARAARRSTTRCRKLREAADFCRYYAAQGRKQFGSEAAMPGPTGESNALTMRRDAASSSRSRPGTFRFAIFLGQVTAALMAGNSVVAKPAEQTPRIARRGRSPAARGPASPGSALYLVTGDGPHRRRAEPRTLTLPASSSPARPRFARLINRTLAAKDGPIAPLIAETGGINAMIADATALPEQVADDVRDLGVPLRRPALLGAAAAVRAGGRRRPHDRDDRGPQRAN